VIESTRFRLIEWGQWFTNEVYIGLPRVTNFARNAGRGGLPLLPDPPQDVVEVDKAVRAVSAEYRRLLVKVYGERGRVVDKAEELRVSKRTLQRRLRLAEEAVDRVLSSCS
jgi:hypothetical protein